MGARGPEKGGREMISVGDFVKADDEQRGRVIELSPDGSEAIIFTPAGDKAIVRVALLTKIPRKP
jgi:hypothetical protein